MTPTPHVSAILPAYNEASNIVPLIQELKAHLPSSHEILLMDDNSPDGTGQMVREAFARDPTVQVHIRLEDRGLAKAIREGIERSSGEKLLIIQTDFNHDPHIAGQFVELSASADMVVGSRFCAGGGMEDRWHYSTSWLYSGFVRFMLRTDVRDNLFGYFIIRRQMVMSLPLEEIFYGYGDYFFRLLWHVRARGGSILEIPAFCRLRRGGKSKSNIVRMLIGYTMEVVKLRARAWKEHRRST